MMAWCQRKSADQECKSVCGANWSCCWPVRWLTLWPINLEIAMNWRLKGASRLCIRLWAGYCRKVTLRGKWWWIGSNLKIVNPELMLVKKKMVVDLGLAMGWRPEDVT